MKLSFAASSVLARQIEAGSNADVFVSADQEWMDYLQARNLIDKASRVNLVGNRLVLIAPADSKLELEIAPGFKLADALGRRPPVHRRSRHRARRADTRAPRSPRSACGTRSRTAWCAPTTCAAP